MAVETNPTSIADTLKNPVLPFEDRPVAPSKTDADYLRTLKLLASDDTRQTALMTGAQNYRDLVSMNSDMDEESIEADIAQRFNPARRASLLAYELVAIEREKRNQETRFLHERVEQDPKFAETLLYISGGAV